MAGCASPPCETAINAFFTGVVQSCTMAAFVCDRCGKCCISLGPSIRIERQLSGRDYYCRSTIDNIVFPARVDPAFEEEIADAFLVQDGSPAGTQPKACPFLRSLSGGNATTCAIYATRPKVCRSFRCYRMIILDPDGNICGRVIGKNTLRTTDTRLQEIWDRQVAGVPCGDAGAWAAALRGILAPHGYRAETVE